MMTKPYISISTYIIGCNYIFILWSHFSCWLFHHDQHASLLSFSSCCYKFLITYINFTSYCCIPHSHICITAPIFQHLCFGTNWNIYCFRPHMQKLAMHVPTHASHVFNFLQPHFWLHPWLWFFSISTCFFFLTSHDGAYPCIQ